MARRAGQGTDDPMLPRPRAADGTGRPRRRSAQAQPEIVVETVQVPNAAPLLARWGEALALAGARKRRGEP